MERSELVQQRVHTGYWDHDWNCAVTTLLTLSEAFCLSVQEQVLDAALGMHGAGGYRAQCGLVEGGLMFIGILGKAQDLADEVVVQSCFEYAEAFEDRFGSLLCRELRPQGFKPDNPPHLCEDLTRKAILFTWDYLAEFVGRKEAAQGPDEPAHPASLAQL